MKRVTEHLVDVREIDGGTKLRHVVPHDASHRREATALAAYFCQEIDAVTRAKKTVEIVGSQIANDGAMSFVPKGMDSRMSEENVLARDFCFVCQLEQFLVDVEKFFCPGCILDVVSPARRLVAIEGIEIV